MKTILILESNPRHDLALSQEIRDLKAVVERSRDQENFQVEIAPAVRPAELQELMLKYEPQIVHFCGHGTGGQGLIFQDNAGQERLIDADALSRMFQEFVAPIADHPVECVVLNACYSELQAEAIVQHVDYVIGMQQAIRDDAARAFSEGFYQGLGYGRSVESAYQMGCTQIMLTCSNGMTTRSGVPLERKAIAIGSQDACPQVELPEYLKPVLRRRRDLAQSEGTLPLSHCPSHITKDDTVCLESPEGQVGVESKFYLPSPYEDRCYEELQKPGSLIRIKSPHNMGKSSLMVRVLAQAAQLGYRSVTLNLEQANQRLFGDLDKFMQWFCAAVGKPLGVRVKTEDYWENDVLGANDNATEYFEKYLLEGSEQPLVVAIDNFDRVFKYSDIETDFCGLLRGWHERSRSNDLWGKLRLVIVYSQEPYLQKDINQSPFNIGLPIELGEFNLDQVQALIRLHGLNWRVQEVKQLMALIGGHPYLVRSALYHIAKGDLSLDEFLRTAPTEAGIFSDYLCGHLKSLEDHPALAAAMKTVVMSEAPVQLRSEDAFKLDSMGLVERVDNAVKPRCELYRRYFGDRLGG